MDPARRLAKVCSDMNKPNGQMVVPPVRGEVLAGGEGVRIYSRAARRFLLTSRGGESSSSVGGEICA